MSARIQNVPSPPRLVAVSGIVFAVLYMVSLVLIRLAVPADPTEPGIWLADPAFRNWVRIALNLVPFTGIAFLWYMAVLRNRVGLLEDRFFATVLLGSGFLFVAMLFAAVSIAKGLLDTFASGLPNQNEVYRLGRGMAYTLMNTFGTRMAAVFMFVTSKMDQDAEHGHGRQRGITGDSRRIVLSTIRAMPKFTSQSHLPRISWCS